MQRAPPSLCPSQRDTVGISTPLSMQIVAKIRALYEIRFSLREFFDAPTIARMSSFVQARVLADIESLTDDQARQLVTSPAVAV